jgi:hypothetical protein
MCVGIALAWSELPTELIERHGLERRAHERGGEREVQFLYRDRHPCLPVWREGQLQIVRWGNRRGESRFLPQGHRILFHVLNRAFSRYSSLAAHFRRLVSMPRRQLVSRLSNPRANRRITLRFAGA